MLFITVNMNINNYLQGCRGYRKHHPQKQLSKNTNNFEYRRLFKFIPWGIVNLNYNERDEILFEHLDLTS